MGVQIYIFFFLYNKYIKILRNFLFRKLPIMKKNTIKSASEEELSKVVGKEKARKILESERFK